MVNFQRSARLIDMTGDRFGALVVVHYAGWRKGQQPKWACRCDCGAVVLCQRHNLLAGRTKSCGCLKRPLGPPLPEHIRRARTAGANRRSEAKRARELSDSYIKKQLRNRGVTNPSADLITKKREQLRLLRQKAE